VCGGFSPLLGCVAFNRRFEVVSCRGDYTGEENIIINSVLPSLNRFNSLRFVRLFDSDVGEIHREENNSYTLVLPSVSLVMFCRLVLCLFRCRGDSQKRSKLILSFSPL